MIEAGRLDKPYKGIVDCFARTYKDEGMISCKSPLVRLLLKSLTHVRCAVWRGNGTNVIRYFPTQALNFAFKDRFKAMFGFKKSESFGLWVFGNIASGAAAGASSSLFVYSLD